jgi:hypothetical protein
MNSITQLLDLEDSDIIISDIQIQGQTKPLTLETLPSAHFCPSNKGSGSSQPDPHESPSN